MKWTGLIALALCLMGPAQAQLLPQLPRVGGVVDRVNGVLPKVSERLGDAQSLVRAQTDRVRDLVRRHPDRVAIDPEGNAVRANELIVLDADETVTQAATARGFRLIERIELDELGVGYARFATPRGMGLARALKQLRAVANGREVSADPLYFASGGVGAPATGSAIQAGGAKGRIGIVDGAVPPGTPGLARQQSFAQGGPRPNDHAAAIASLLTGGGGVRASAPGARLHVADVYGGDPAGGNAAAIGQALAWMTRERVPVVVVSLAGPRNPLLGRIVAAARRLGTVIVAAVGNDGPAAKPAYPASYPEAIAVTGVDARGRVLIEAGRAAKLDYAAPGADLLGLGLDGKARKLRGTSFAAPFVAARFSAQLGEDIAGALAGLDREAKGRGKRGLGRGVLCGDCATRPR
ncbi:S8 family serine peptidase [Sphingomonas sp. IW22]|uniref:S8 family serine peptidase n=1 Tax=Sphingomonas sp. IW22 TaxID=3242489 RepID=UPI0035204E42